MTPLGTPLFDLSGMGAGPRAARPAGRAADGPGAVLLYGDGFGTIVLAQTTTTPQIEKQLKQLPALFGDRPVNGHQAAVVTTPLGGVSSGSRATRHSWPRGMVPAADLKAFARSVR